MKRLSFIAILASAAIPFAALSAPKPERVRGTVESISQNQLVVRSEAGEAVDVGLTGDTKYATAHRSSLSEIETGSYIGTATKGTGDFLVALEVTIFPPSMKGAGEGHYPWDPLPDVAAPGKGETATSMTNGSVAAKAPANEKVVSNMTNGTVSEEREKSGAPLLTVSYKGGEQTVAVPPTAPVVKLAPAAMSAVKQGDHVFIAASRDGQAATARFVVVGADGLRPPM